MGENKTKSLSKHKYVLVSILAFLVGAGIGFGIFCLATFLHGAILCQKGSRFVGKHCLPIDGFEEECKTCKSEIDTQLESGVLVQLDPSKDKYDSCRAVCFCGTGLIRYSATGN